MFNQVINLILTVTIVTAVPFDDYDLFRELEIALIENKITLDDLFADFSDNFESNEINQFNSIYEMFDPLIDHRIIRNPLKTELDLRWNPIQMIEYRGFKAESHQIVTEDCYILTIHRIINPLEKTLNKPPILLQHGLIDSSVGWMFNQITGDIHDNDNRNLAFALAKNGYDVWLGNYRGNTYSKNHTKLSIKDQQYWKFTFDNHALQDLPAQIAYVQNATNHDQIGYVGFSQGTLTMFQLSSFKPEVAQAIKPYIALAPVAYLGNLASPIRFLAKSRLIMRSMLFRNAEFLANSQLSRAFSAMACRAFPGLVCRNLLYLFCGFSEQQMNSTRMPVYFNHLPAGTSLANVVHYGLNYRSRMPEMLDYMTPAQNQECYGQDTAPQFPLENITHKYMHLVSAHNDLLASPKDVELLKNSLNVKFEEKFVELKKFGHVDFILSQRADYYVNQYILDVLNTTRPAQKVESRDRFRLKQYNENSCNVPNRNTRCHLDLKRALRMI